MILYKETIDDMMAEIGRTLAHVNQESIEAAIHDLVDAERLFIAGAGRSGQVMKCFAIRLMHLGMQVYVIGETVTPRIGDSDLLVIGSGSGRTDSLVVFAKKAKSVGAKLLLFTIDPESPIGEISDRIVQISAPSHKLIEETFNNISVQPKGSLFEQCLFILQEYTIIELMKKTNLSSDDLFLRHANLE